MIEKVDRIGEIEYNFLGSKMVVKNYRKRNDIDVYFPEYNYTRYGVSYGNFIKKTIKSPYDRSVSGVGYLGEGKHKVDSNDIKYKYWSSMICRCYNDICLELDPTYKDCIVCEEWHNYQNFGDWFDDNYYEVDGQKMELDKDILIKSNKTYSPETCVFVPHEINSLFCKSNKARGGYPIGVHRHSDGGFVSQCNNRFATKRYLGYYDTWEEAFLAYKPVKEMVIQRIADEYKDVIPIRLYNAMYSYVVEITD